MINEIISIGDKVDLYRIVDAMGEPVDPPKHFASKLEDTIQGDTLYLSMPFNGSRVVTLGKGEIYLVWFYTHSGIYQCKAEIVDRKKEDNIYIAICKILTQIEKTQRREYYRLDCFFDLHYRLITNEEVRLVNRLKRNQYDAEEEFLNDEQDLKEIQELFDSGTVIDISGGGIRFNASNHLEKDSVVLMRIPLMIDEEEVVIEAKGIVISSNELINRRGMFDNRIQFVKMKESYRELIIKFIFQQDRKKLHKEKG